MNLKSFSLVLLFSMFFYQTAFCASPTTQPIDQYQLKIYSDGSGTFGLPQEQDNRWHIRIMKDEMTDEMIITAYRRSLLPKSDNDIVKMLFEIEKKDFEEAKRNGRISKDKQLAVPEALNESIRKRREEGPLGLFINLSKASNEYICVLGHNFPGRTAMIGIDKNNSIKTNEEGCIILSKELDTQLRNGQVVKVRGRKWPNDWDITFDVYLDGYALLTEYLRSKR